MKVGKSNIVLTAKGCIDCGTDHSTAWTAAKRVAVTIDGNKSSLTLHRCWKCFKRLGDRSRTRAKKSGRRR